MEDHILINISVISSCIILVLTVVYILRRTRGLQSMDLLEFLISLLFTTLLINIYLANWFIAVVQVMFTVIYLLEYLRLRRIT